MTPDVTVEVAFGFGPYDPEPLAMDWVDITDSVLEISIQRGRESEFDRFPASTATVVLLNDDRQWDPLNDAVGSWGLYGVLVPNVPIRITATVSSTDYPVWRGYVDGWPAEYTEGGFRSQTIVTCTDAFKVLAERRLPDTYREYLESLGTLAGLFRFDTADNGVLVNEGPRGRDGTSTTAVDTTDGTVAVSSGALSIPEQVPPAGKYVSGAVIPIVDAGEDSLTLDTSWTVSFVVTCAKRGARLFFCTAMPDDTEPVACYVDANGEPWLLVDGVGATLQCQGLGYDLADGLPHHLVAVRSTTTASLYLDGVLIASDTDGAATGFYDYSGGSHRIGRSLVGDGTTITPEIVIDELACWDEALTATEVAALHDYLDVGWSGERISGVAIGDTLDEIGWLSGLRDIDDGEVVVNLPVNPQGLTVLDVIQRIADSESGRLFIDAAGRVAFHGRDRFIRETVENTVQYTFTDTDRDTTPSDVGVLDGTLRVVVDDRNVYQSAEITRVGGITQRAGSVTPVRTYTASDLLIATDEGALSLAEWVVFRYGNPLVRSDAWQVDPEVLPADWADILDLEIGHRVKLDLTPGGVGSSLDLELHVSLIAHEITPERWLITLNGTPVDPADYFLWAATETASTDNGWADTDNDPPGGAWG